MVGKQTAITVAAVLDTHEALQLVRDVTESQSFTIYALTILNMYQDQAGFHAFFPESLERIQALLNGRFEDGVTTAHLPPPNLRGPAIPRCKKGRMAS